MAELKTMWRVLAEDVLPDMVQMDNGEWPWRVARRYAKAGSADQTAYRVRGSWKKDGMRLPDVYGGEEGVWDAKVERVVRGVRGKWGPGVLWVRYIGTRTEIGER